MTDYSFSSITSSPAFRSAAIIIGAILGTSLLARLIRRTIRNRVHDNEIRYRTSKLVSIVGYFVILVVAISELSGAMSGFTVAIGAASAGIAFSLQEVIASFAGWLAVAFGNFYKVGDRVQLGGIKGDVIDIGFIRTTIMEIGSWVNGDLYNGRIVRVANSFVFKEPVFNYSGEFSFVWDEITIPIKYGSNYDTARKILVAAADECVGEYVAAAKTNWAQLVKSYQIEDARIEPMVSMIANDNWVEFTLRYVVDCRARRLAKDKLFAHILQAVEASGSDVGMASMTVHLVEAPSFNVNVTGSSAKSALKP